MIKAHVIAGRDAFDVEMVNYHIASVKRAINASESKNYSMP
jgi:hypothetical protein